MDLHESTIPEIHESSATNKSLELLSTKFTEYVNKMKTNIFNANR